MVGFNRKGSEPAVSNDGEVSTVSAAVRIRLLREIAEVLAAATPEQGIAPADAARYVSNALSMQRGIDAVLVDGVDAFGPEMLIANPPTRSGAMLAHAARSFALCTRSLDNPRTRGDIVHAMQLPNAIGTVRDPNDG